MARMADTILALHVWESMPHGGFGFAAPENAEAQREFDTFLEKHLA